MRAIKAMTMAALMAAATVAAQERTDGDPHLWLEEVTGETALDWVRARNKVSQAALEATPGFERLEADLLEILDSDEKIPYVRKIGDHYYNFWQDRQHVRGIWRRTTLAEYRKPEPRWETVIDLDALAQAEDENWVWHGAACRKPDYDRCLVSLSRGGADADVTREFDLAAKSFVEDGFFLPEAKGGAAWIDRDTVFVATDFGEGSMTSSGYPRILKLWKRGTPLAAASTVFEGEPTDVSVAGFVADTQGRRYQIVYRGITFYTRQYFLRDAGSGELTRVEVPEHAELSVWGPWLLVEPKEDWTVGEHTWPQGALLVTGVDEYLAGKREFEVLYEPGPRKSLAGYEGTRDHLLVLELDNVTDRLYEWKVQDGQWWRRRVAVPALGNLGVEAVDEDAGNDYFLTYTDFLTPTSLYLAASGSDGRERLKELPAYFDATGVTVSQHEAVSKDGTRVPYFQVAPEGIAPDGDNPTLLYGYGGFEIALTPSYAASVGRGWLSQGGVYVLANIRGGGEFGPAWHRAALKHNRQRAYDDFIAIAQDLIARKVTSPRRLGIQGGSNGGLLMGVMLTQRPDLWGAVVIQVPLLDMRRYNQLLAGASWMGEYGNPDVPEEWAFISKYSPYQNVKPDVDYPPVLFTTSTRDDRVHPGHARKMMARLIELGHDDLLYYENIEGGHGGAANNAQRAYMQALAYAFLRRELVD
ncbi:MAG TPA: prolyl oligopeptidase family serine peptidase [Xanthomonadaceae bacterium]|nr:prolyl oligopeptidase family serine peptidase [Xanthomonadaceae bacterium]